jgi:hypothetical protein
MLKITLLLVCISVCGCFPVFAQPADKAGEQAAIREDLWVCPVFETGFYGVSNPSFGGGLAVGYGGKMAFGIKAVFWGDMDEVRALELNVLVRHYFWNSGLFLQFSGGPAIFINPTKTATISAGLSLGWRFLLGRYFFIEPVIRGGYPYFVTGGLSAGLRF